MISAARLVLDQSEAGVATEIDKVPAWQFAIYFHELSEICPDRLKWGGERILQRNALRIEILPENHPRCACLSPDGRGLAWVRSGGSPYAYGHCLGSACPRVQVTR